MAGIRLTPNSNVQSTTINYPSGATGSTPQLQIINSPGGSKGQIQFHSDNGSFAGDSNFIWNSKTRTMSVLGNIRISDNIIGKYNTNLTNLKITGGNSGQVLSTNGAGNLSWIDQISAASYANSNVANYLPTYTGNLNGGNLTITGTSYIYDISSTGSALLTTVDISANLTTNAIYTDNYFYANGDPFISDTGNITFNGDNIESSNDINIIPDTTANFAVTTSRIESISSDCYIGLTNEFVADTEFNDDITSVQVGWTVTISGTTYTVSAIDPSPPANQFRATVTGATFVSGTNYTFTNPVPVEATWSIDQYGTLTTPAGGTINQFNDDFKIEVTGTDVIDFRTDGGDLILDAEGNLVINGPINSSTGVARLDLTGGLAYLTASDSDLTAVNMNDISVQMYAGVSVGVTAGVIIPQLETDYTDSTNVLEILFTQNESEVGYPWGITLPVSHITYNELILLAPDTFPNQAACTTQANNTQNTWELWQDTITQSNVRITSNELNWTFDGEGNLTLPGNSSSINYANGSPYGGSGSGGYIIPYEVAAFVANTQPGFGEIQFATFEGSNSIPATAQKLFINQGAQNEQGLGTILQQWTSSSYRGTLSLNNGSDSQATFNISNGGIYFNPEVYRGFSAGLNQIWGDDPSINQLIITNATAPKFYNTEFLLQDDVFHATSLDTGNTHVMLNIYGSSQYNPIKLNDLWNVFTSFVDNVLYDGETLRTNPDDIKEQFYTNAGSFRDNIPTQDLYQYFRFVNNTYFNAAPTTGGSGTDATVRIRVNANNTYTVLGVAVSGFGYIGGETLVVSGTNLGGTSPTNDLTLLIDSVDGDGRITQVSYLSGDSLYPWPTNNISDGGSDQYDTGNYINTNLATEISYGGGTTQTASADFGGGDYCVMYNQSFFCMVVTGSNISDLFYSGNLGSDGSGLLRWTGLRSNQNVIANNNALYAYFDSEYLDGELTPTVGVTYNMVLDSAGINLDEYYAYYNDATNDYYFGSNNDWRLESQNSLYVQSYNDMFIQTVVNERGIGESGPTLNINAGDGSPGQQEINAQAGNGGTVNIRGGDAGGSDDIDTLGNTGGTVYIYGGGGSGSSQAGGVHLHGGVNESATGIAGNINLYTSNGDGGHGKVTINTSDGNNRYWAFNANGTTNFPTLTVDLHNGGTQSAQTLQFGDITQQVIITGPTPEVDSNAQRIIIQGQHGNGTGEGGDVYVWGGDADFNGGDIKIYAGDADSGTNGYGGYVNIEGGSGFDNGGYVSLQAGSTNNGQGAPVSMTGGSGSTTGGEANLTGGGGAINGGNVNIIGGSSGGSGDGGTINITGGTSGNGLQSYGNVVINAGANTWSFDNNANLTLPTVSLGSGVNEKAVIRSQRKIIPSLHYSALIDGSTPTVVYTASSTAISSLKITFNITHSGLGQEMFDVSALNAGANVIYSVSNRLNGTAGPDTTVSVDLGGTGVLEVTLTVNSGTTDSWVTYDSTEFGYQTP